MPKAPSDSTTGVLTGPPRQLVEWRRRFLRSLVGADERPRDLRRIERTALPIALFVVGAVIAALRLPLASWNTLWAEDGTVFLQGALQDGLGAIVLPYAGYLHIVPRLVAELATAVVPLTAVPLSFTLLAGVVTSAVATTTYLFARERLDSRILQLVLWLQVLVLPVAGGEVTGSLANLHWTLMFGAFWAAIITPRSRALAVIQGIVVAAAILSDPLTIALLVPVILVRLANSGLKRPGTLVLVYGGASLLQVIGVVSGALSGHARTVSHSFPSGHAFADVYAIRVALGSIVGIGATPPIAGTLGTLTTPVVLAVVLGVVLVTVLFDPRRRAVVLAFAGASLLLSIVSFILVWDGLSVGPLALHTGDRYMVVPTFLLFSALCICADSAASALRVRGIGWLPPVAVALIVICVGISNYRVWNVREGTADWPDAVAVASQACLADNADAERLAIAPPWFPGAVIPCEMLTK